MLAKICGPLWWMLMLSLASAGIAQEPTPEDLDARMAPVIKRFEDLAGLKAEKVAAEQVEKQILAQLKTKADDAALKKALAAAQAETRKKTASFERAARDRTLRAATAPLARQLVAANPKEGTLAVLRAIDRPCIQQLAQGPGGPAVAGLQDGLTSAIGPENIAAVRAGIEQYCAEHAGSPAVLCAAKSLYWKTGADPLETMHAAELPKALRDQAVLQYVEASLTEIRGAATVHALETAVNAVPEEYRAEVKTQVLADPRSVPGADQKDDYLAFIAGHPKRAELKLGYFLKTRSAADLKALVLERITSAPGHYGQDMNAPGILRVLPAADVVELDVAAQGQAADLIPSVVLRRSTPGDPVRMTALAAQAYAEECKFALRDANGRITRDTVRAVLEHVVDGKGELAVPVSDAAKAFGAKLPEGTYPASMFRGEFLAAAQLAYGQLKAATSDKDYVQAATRLRHAIQCLDRCYNGRSLQTIKWLNGQLDTCPVPELAKQ